MNAVTKEWATHLLVNLRNRSTIGSASHTRKLPLPPVGDMWTRNGLDLSDPEDEKFVRSALRQHHNRYSPQYHALPCNGESQDRERVATCHQCDRRYNPDKERCPCHRPRCPSRHGMWACDRCNRTPTDSGV